MSYLSYDVVFLSNITLDNRKSHDENSVKELKSHFRSKFSERVEIPLSFKIQWKSWTPTFVLNSEKSWNPTFVLNQWTSWNPTFVLNSEKELKSHFRSKFSERVEIPLSFYIQWTSWNPTFVLNSVNELKSHFRS